MSSILIQRLKNANCKTILSIQSENSQGHSCYGEIRAKRVDKGNGMQDGIIRKDGDMGGGQRKLGARTGSIG